MLNFVIFRAIINVLTKYSSTKDCCYDVHPMNALYITFVIISRGLMNFVINLRVAQKCGVIFVFYDLFYELCVQKGVNPSKACLEMGLSRSLAAKWKNTSATPSAEVMSKIADYFHVSTDYLLGKGPQNDELPALTKKDERDIAKQLDIMVGQLGGDHDGLMFDGEPLDDETRELLVESLRKDLEWAKRMAKKKYTPKKYRKPTE